jgi:hypothetical protein
VSLHLLRPRASPQDTERENHRYFLLVVFGIYVGAKEQNHKDVQGGIGHRCVSERLEGDPLKTLQSGFGNVLLGWPLGKQTHSFGRGDHERHRIKPVTE